MVRGRGSYDDPAVVAAGEADPDPGEHGHRHERDGSLADPPDAQSTSAQPVDLAQVGAVRPRPRVLLQQPGQLVGGHQLAPLVPLRPGWAARTFASARDVVLLTVPTEMSSSSATARSVSSQ